MERSCNITNATQHLSVGINHVLTGTDGPTLGLYIIVVSISTPGNLLLIYVVIKNQSMRTFTNFLICNTAVSDLMTTIIPGVLNLADTMIPHQHMLIFGGCMCKLVYMSTYWSVTVTIISLVVIAIDRYCLVMYPHRKYLTNKKLRYIIPLIWIVGFLFASPAIFTMELKHTNGAEVCVENWVRPFDPIKSPRYYIIILFIFLYAIPLVVMTIIYTLIGIRLSGVRITYDIRKVTGVHLRIHKERSNLRIHKERLNTTSTSTCDTDLDGSMNGSNTQLNEDKEIAGVRFYPPLVQQVNVIGSKKLRIIKMLVSIIICFVICWSPVYVIQFLTFFHPYYSRCPDAIADWIHIIALCLQYSNGAVNPLLYFGFSHTYRKGLKLSLGYFRRKNDMLLSTHI